MRGISKSLKISVATALLLGLAACAGQKTQATIAEVETGLTGAEMLGLQYEHLPPCFGAVPKLCSKDAVVKDIKKADTVAYGAVKAARASNAPNDIAAAEDAVLSLMATVPTVVQPAK